MSYSLAGRGNERGEWVGYPYRPDAWNPVLVAVFYPFKKVFSSEFLSSLGTRGPNARAKSKLVILPENGLLNPVEKSKKYY